MATKAANRKSRASSDDEESKPTSGKHWWQWLLLYPSFAVAILTAGPQWYDRINGYVLGVASASQAEKQAQLWQKNASCVGLNSNGYLSPRKIAVDATLNQNSSQPNSQLAIGTAFPKAVKQWHIQRTCYFVRTRHCGGPNAPMVSRTSESRWSRAFVRQL